MFQTCFLKAVGYLLNTDQVTLKLLYFDMRLWPFKGRFLLVSNISNFANLSYILLESTVYKEMSNF